MTRYLSIDGVISQKKTPGAKKLTDDEYRQALDAKQRGESPVLRGGTMRILAREKRTIYGPDGGRLEIPINEDVPEGFTETAPPPTEAEQLEAERRRIHVRLDELDRLSRRAERAKASTLIDDDQRAVEQGFIDQYEAEAQSLRAELSDLD